jgi:TonB family protein
MTQTWIDSAASPVLASLAEPALRALVLAAMTGVALALLRVRRTSLKLCVWTVVLGAAFAMPMLDRVVPVVPLRVLPAEVRDGGPGLQTRPQVANLETGAARDGGQGLQTLPQRAGLKARPSMVSAVVLDGGAGLQARPQPWRLALVVVYLLGAVALLARAGIGWIAARRLARMASLIDDGMALDQVAALASRAGLTRSPRLAESEACVVPLTMGVMRPVILLPTDWREWPQTTLEAVLTHELAHVARRDALTQSLALVHRAVFWFSPLGWWLRRHLMQLAEYASDEAVLAGGVDRTTYAETLMGFFGALGRDGRRAEWSALSASSGHVAMAQGSGPERRLARIIEWNGRSHRLTTAAAIAVVIVALFAVGVIAAIQPARKTIEWPKPAEAIEVRATPPPPMPAAGELAKPAELKVNFSGPWKRDAAHSSLVSLFMDPAGRDIAVTLHLSQLADGTLRVSESWVITEPAGAQSVNAGLRTYKLEIPGRSPGFSWDGDAMVVQAERSAYSRFSLRLSADGSLLLTATPRDPKAPVVTATYRRGGAVAPQSSSWQADRAAMFQQLIDSAQWVLEGNRVKIRIGTLAPLDAAGPEQTLAGLRRAAEADASRPADSVTASPADIAALKARFADATIALDKIGSRFDVGLSTTKDVDDALMAALAVLQRPGTPDMSAAQPGSVRLKNSAAGRLFMIFVDTANIAFNETPRLRDQLHRLVNTWLQAGDLVAMISTGQSSISVNQTYDRTKIDDAISRITGSGMTPRDAIEVQRTGDTSALQEQTKHGLATAIDIMKQLASITGKKKIFFWVSGGYVLEPAAASAVRPGTSARDMMEQFASLARQAEAELYLINTRGPTAYPAAISSEQQAYVDNTANSLKTLGALTGGSVVTNLNDSPSAPQSFATGAHRGTEPRAVAPRVIHDVKPRYTPEAIRAKIQGLVGVEAIVEADGSISNARIARSLDTDFGLDTQALLAAYGWQFTPGLIDGKPARFVITFDMTFTLR